MGDDIADLGLICRMEISKRVKGAFQGFYMCNQHVRSAGPQACLYGLHLMSVIKVC